MASTSSLKEAMHDYLRRARAGMLARIDGLSEYDRRRPMTPTGTNLLGLVKHLTFYESYYLGGVFGREPEWTLPWIEDDTIWQGADMWATPDETSPYLLGRYQAACAHADATIAALELDTPATVPWWKQTKRNTTLGVPADSHDRRDQPASGPCRHHPRADRRHDRVRHYGDTEWWRAFHDNIRAAANTFRDQRS